MSVSSFTSSGRGRNAARARSAAARAPSGREGRQGLVQQRLGAGRRASASPSRAGSVALPAAASLPARLPSVAVSAVRSSRSSAIWKARPSSRPIGVDGRRVGAGAARPARPRRRPAGRRSCSASAPAPRPRRAAGARPSMSALLPLDHEQRRCRPAAAPAPAPRARRRPAGGGRPATGARRRPAPRWPRRRPCGRWAGRAAGRRRPWPAGRRGPASRCGRTPWPARSAWPASRRRRRRRGPRQAARTSAGRSRLPPPSRAYFMASTSRAGADAAPRLDQRGQAGVDARGDDLQVGLDGERLAHGGGLLACPAPGFTPPGGGRVPPGQAGPAEITTDPGDLGLTSGPGAPP